MKNSSNPFKNKNHPFQFILMEILDIVDDNNQVTGKADRKEIYDKNLPHRIVHVLVFNSSGEMLVQLSSRQKSFRPNYWGTSAGGHVMSGESYEQAATRELKEEIGVEGKLEPFCEELYVHEGKLKKFIKVFRTVIDEGFDLKKDEVEKIGFFPLEVIQDMVNNDENFHPELLMILQKHFGIQ